MGTDAKDRFDARAQAWADYNRRPLGHIRREVTWHNLLPYMPAVTDPQTPPRVLDVGGGSGELALKLIRLGYRVWLLDYAPGMLDEARKAAEDLAEEERARLSFCLLSMEDANHSFDPGFFDAVTCHTLIEYVPHPQTALSHLATLLAAGGLLSVSFVNVHAKVLREVWSQQDPAAALAQLEPGRRNGCRSPAGAPTEHAFCASLFDVSGVAYTCEQVSMWLSKLGLRVVAERGVRVFADYLPPGRLEDPAFFDALLRLEKAVADRTPYRQLARYRHLLARAPMHSNGCHLPPAP
jgi:S-adenosylmethionine-dependent methyltransferase